MTDAEGHTTRLTYDLNDRATEVTDANGTLTKYGYDQNSNLATVTDGNGHVTTFEYDAFNRTTKIINPLGQTQLLTYDTQGNLIRTQDADNRLNFYSYDRLNRLTNKSIQGGFNTIVKYDKVGNVVDIASNTPSKLSLVYDKTNRLMEVQTGATTIQPATTIAYTYDANGNRLTMTDPLGGVTKNTYDNLNQLKAFTNPKGETFSFAFDALSRRTTTTYPNNAATAYQYDAASRLKSLVTQAGGVTLDRFDYAYDKIGNRTMLTDLAGVHTYLYDAVSQLTAATHPTGTNPTEAFTLDPAGNRTASHLSSTYTHDAANRLLADQAFTYSYGKNGNLLQKTETATGKNSRYTYDGDNRLTFIQFFSPPLPSVSYAYDGLGRRIQKNVGGKVTRYVYDGEDILMEYDGTNTGQTRYTHGPGIDEPLAVDRNGQSFLYHADGLGSLTTLSNATGSQAQSYRYDSFGNIVNQIGSLPNPYTYTGREYDEETGLYYYRARYYDPQIGRFISEDPIGFAAGDLNLYRYVFNNSINQIDPNGEIAIGWIATGAVVGAVVNVGITYWANGGNPTSEQVRAAAVSGAISGAIVAVAGPSGGTIAKGLIAKGLIGAKSSGLVASVASRVLVAGGSALGQFVANAIDPCHATSPLKTALYGLLSYELNQGFFPTNNMNTWAQAKHFAPTTFKGLLRYAWPKALTSSVTGVAKIFHR